MSQGFARKRGASWTAYLQVVDPANGKRRQITKGGFRTKKAALDYLDDLKTARREHRWTEPRKATVAGFLADEWLPSVQKRPTTMANYRAMIGAYVVPRIGAVPLAQLSAAQVRGMRDDLLAAGARGGKPLSPRTVRLALLVLRMALDVAVVRGYVLRNVAKDVPNPVSERREVDAWTAEEVAVFLASIADDRLYAMWLLALSRGMRRGELVGLRWSDIDLKAKRLSVTRAVVLVDGDPVESGPKTSAGRRTVPLDDELVAALRHHRQRQREDRLAWGPGWHDSGAVFTREDGAELHPEWVSTAWEIRVRRAGVRLISVHGARHTAATLALRAGIPTEATRQQRSHKTSTSTSPRRCPRIRRRSSRPLCWAGARERLLSCRDELRV